MADNGCARRGSGPAVLLLVLLVVFPDWVVHRPSQSAGKVFTSTPVSQEETSLRVEEPSEPGRTLYPATTAPGISAFTPGPPETPEQPVSYVDDLPPDALEIAATGDVNLGGPLAEVIAGNPDYPWSGIAEHLRRADLAVVNLECSISERGTPFPKQFTFRGPPAALPAMRRAGVDVASLANNHSLDYGPDALLDTIGGLRAAGIAPVGAGSIDSEAWHPHVVTSERIRVAFVAASRVIPHESWSVTASRPGLATAYAEDRLLAEVRHARSAADVVVVLIHWGVEGRTSPEPYQVSLAHRLVDSGAAIVIGHHPHVLQPVVQYRGAVIAYSLGNFVFTARRGFQETMLLRVGILPTGELVAARLPVTIVHGQPRPAA